MESAAHPCLDGPQRQVHMTFSSQAEPSCRDLVKRVTSCGRNRVANVERNGLERRVSAQAGGVSQKRGDSRYTHRPAGAVRYSEHSVSLDSSHRACLTQSSGEKREASCATNTWLCVSAHSGKTDATMHIYNYFSPSANMETHHHRNVFHTVPRLPAAYLSNSP